MFLQFDGILFGGDDQLRTGLTGAVFDGLQLLDGILVMVRKIILVHDLHRHLFQRVKKIEWMGDAAKRLDRLVPHRFDPQLLPRAEVDDRLHPESGFDDRHLFAVVPVDPIAVVFPAAPGQADQVGPLHRGQRFAQLTRGKHHAVAERVGFVA